MCALIGADRLIYQDLAELERAVLGKNRALAGFDNSCFSGHYVTGLDAGYLDELALRRSDAARRERRGNAA